MTKKRLTVNVDAELIPPAKRYARARGVSLSSLVEQSLRDLAVTEPHGATGESGESEGTLNDGDRYDGYLAKKSKLQEPENGAPPENESGDLSGFELPPGDPPREGATSWAKRWAGILKDKPGPPPGEDPRYDYLARKYDL